MALAAVTSLAPLLALPGDSASVSGVFSATDTADLNSLADPATTTRPTDVIVEGIVASNLVSKHGKYFRISFAGVDDERGFCCIYKPELLPALQAKFGSGDGLGLLGQGIRVIGRVEINKGRPAIRIESVDQINLAQSKHDVQRD